MAHYEYGTVEVPEQGTYLRFDHRRPLCPTCGGHVLIKDRAFDIYRCTACGQRLSPVYGRFGMPVYEPDHQIKLEPIEKEPEVVGLYDTASGKWIGEKGWPLTCRLSELTKRPWFLSGYMKPGIELRILNPDLTPGEAVPLPGKPEEFEEALKATLERLAGGASKDAGSRE